MGETVLRFGTVSKFKSQLIHFVLGIMAYNIQHLVLFIGIFYMSPPQAAAGNLLDLSYHGRTKSWNDTITTTASSFFDTYTTPDPVDSWMLPNTTSRVFVWILGLTALIGNAFVLIWRCTGRGTENAVQIRLIANLAASDFFMGVYMIIIASVDMKFKHGFAAEASWWKSGVVCKLASILAVFATESSVLIITLISIDRLMAVSIRYPRISKFRPSETSVTVICLILWAIAVTLAVVPTVVLPAPEVQSDVCLTLPLFTCTSSIHTSNSSIYVLDEATALASKPTDLTENDQPESGIYFMMSIFLGLNMFCLLVVALCYISIFYLVRQSTKKLGMTRAKNEVRMCFRMGLIVLTNFATCMPVVIMGILVQTDIIYISHDVYIFIVIFIIPINSASNPYLYTFSAIIYNYIDHKHYHVANRRGTIPSIV